MRAGSYTVRAGVPESETEYVGTSAALPFTIAKAVIKIKADDKTAQAHSPMPKLTYTVSGLVDKENLVKEPELACSADMKKAGSYPVTAGGAEAPDTGNYQEAIIYENGTLTVVERSTDGGSGGQGSGSSGGGSSSQGSGGSNGQGSGSHGGGLNGQGSGSHGGGSSSQSGGSFGGADTKQPSLKDSSGREGWDVILAEVQKAAAAQGGTVAVDMNGAAAVPGSIFENIRGRDVTVRFDMGGGMIWSVNGKDVAEDAVNDTDFSVKAGAGAVPKELVEKTAGGLAHLELSLAHDGLFGFAATLIIRIGGSAGGITAGGAASAEYTGMNANLFYYNPTLRSLEFICAGKIAQDGTAELPFVHASDYMVILSAQPMGGTGTAESPQEPEESSHAKVKSVKLSKTVFTYSGKAKKPSVTAIDTKGKKISSKYYTVSYKNNQKVGKAAVTVKFKNGYSGTVVKTFTIRPAGTFVKKITAAPGGFTIKWKKKTAQTSGYQIQFSRNKEFKGNSVRSVSVKKTSAVKKEVKNLKSGKKYFVRIRTYKIVKSGVKNTKIYSAWSDAVWIKTRPASSGSSS